MPRRWIFDAPPAPCDATYSYGKDPRQIAELRLPVGARAAEPVPTVLVIHGGFWLAEFDRGHVSHLCARLAVLGMATWSLEFRRLGHIGGGFPGTFRDVAAGADLLRDVAGEHGLDLRRVTALGHSAGGHLALWLAGRQTLPADHRLYRPEPLRIHRVVSLAGIGDLAAAWRERLCFDVVEHLLGGSPEAVPERYEVASPGSRLPLGVPQALFHGAADRLVPVELGASYAAAARAAGDAVELQILPGAGHFELIDPRSSEWRSIESVLTAGFGLSGGSSATVDGS